MQKGVFKSHFFGFGSSFWFFILSWRRQKRPCSCNLEVLSLVQQQALSSKSFFSSCLSSSNSSSSSYYSSYYSYYFHILVFSLWKFNLCFFFFSFLRQPLLRKHSFFGLAVSFFCVSPLFFYLLLILKQTSLKSPLQTQIAFIFGCFVLLLLFCFFVFWLFVFMLSVCFCLVFVVLVVSLVLISDHDNKTMFFENIVFLWNVGWRLFIILIYVFVIGFLVGLFVTIQKWRWNVLCACCLFLFYNTRLDCFFFESCCLVIFFLVFFWFFIPIKKISKKEKRTQQIHRKPKMQKNTPNVFLS